MAVRIWFNHWFSSVYNIIDMMRRDCVQELYVIGSNKRSAAVYKSVCDEWHVEPDGCSAAEYVEYCLAFCQEHQVEVFVPRRELVAIAENAERFEEIGVKLFCSVDKALVRLLEDKGGTYDYFREKGFDCIPEVRLVHSVEEFVAAYHELKTEDTRVCYKLNEDEGARSFRVIDERLSQKRALMEKPGFKISLENAVAVLSQYDFTIPVMLMTYLEGTETSVDCLRTEKGNLIIPRTKMAGRYSEVAFDEDVMALCGQIMDAVNASMPINIQLRRHRGRVYLLEINPRMSGGLQLSCEATGINLPGIAINRLLGAETDWSYPDIGRVQVAHVEKPVRLN